MSWWKSRKCRVCRAKIPKGVEASEVRLDTLEGIVSIEVCDECADFFDKSAEVLRRSDPDEDEEDESV